MTGTSVTVPGIERIDGRTGDGSAGLVTAFSSFEPYELTTYLEELATALPGVKIVIERMPTGLLADEFCRRVPAERPCMILGWADTAATATEFSSFISRPVGSPACDPDGLIRPTGFSVAFICDQPGLAACGRSPPTTWHELTEPHLRRHLVFPDPRVSGAGFLALSTILQAFGDDDGATRGGGLGGRSLRDHPVCPRSHSRKRRTGLVRRSRTRDHVQALLEGHVYDRRCPVPN